MASGLILMLHMAKYSCYTWHWCAFGIISLFRSFFPASNVKVYYFNTIVLWRGKNPLLFMTLIVILQYKNQQNEKIRVHIIILNPPLFPHEEEVLYQKLPLLLLLLSLILLVEQSTGNLLRQWACPYLPMPIRLLHDLFQHIE